MAIAKLIRHKLPCTDPIPAKLIKTEGSAIHYDIHKLINSILNKYKLPEQWTQLIILPVYKKGDKQTAGIVQAYHFLSTTNKILCNILLSRLIPHVGM